MKTFSILATFLAGAFLAGAPAAALAETPKTVRAASVDAKPVKKIASAVDPSKPLKKKKKAKQPVEEAAADPAVRELRSDNQSVGFFDALFGGPIKMLPETRAQDQLLEERQATSKKKFRVKPEFEPQTVAYSGYPSGTIVIDTKTRFLYLMEGRNKARRYAIAVGREGLLFTGTAKVGDKQEWPRWIPTKEMQEREPKHYGQYKDGMPGGPDNPLGARAIYLYQGRLDTHIRIHGTNQPWTIGTAASNGCFRMVNEHVMDLYGRVRLGTTVVVL